ncbi:MAG TPA: hypothetical protein VFX50_14280 [Gemmatimonadales bacterium]|nr:hypothetical protein [Gemmatimonadales bacterium]
MPLRDARGMALVALVALVVVTGCDRKEGAAPAARPEGVPEDNAHRPAELPRDTAGDHTAVPPDTAEYLARGNEPFWAVTVTHAGIVFLEPDRPDGVHGPYAPPTRRGVRLVYQTVLHDTVATPLELTLEAKPCSDGMSDQAYVYAAVARIGDRVLHGCAERRAPARR